MKRAIDLLNGNAGGSSRHQCAARTYTFVSLTLLAMLLHLFSVQAYGVQTPREKLSMALEDLNSGRIEAGWNRLDQIIAELHDEQEDVEKLVVLGRAYFYVEEDDAALAALSRAIAIDPAHAQAHFFVGLIHHYGSDLTEALPFLETATALAPMIDGYWLELGRVYSGLGMKEQALTAYTHAIDLAPENTSALYNSGVILYELDRKPEALERFMAVLAIAPEISDAAYNAGQLLQDMGRYEEALHYFELLLPTEELGWPARTKLVQLYQALGQYEQRDQAREELLAFRVQGDTLQLLIDGYIRDQFQHGTWFIGVVEYFELEGEMPVRYLFEVIDAESRRKELNITLGSYEWTRTVAEELGATDGKQLFHLDGYMRDGSHTAYMFYAGEPSYDMVRSQVIEILDKL